ncbi:MAG: hypothetical protein ABIJ27_06780 [Candidatus Omnitrophota bacterium]
MKITKPLDNILNTEAKTKILRFLCTTGAEWNGSQIAREIGVTPAASLSSLNELSKEGIVMMNNVGNARVYKLNDDNFAVSDLLKPLFYEEDKVLSKIINIIKRSLATSRLRSKIVSVALFGSVQVRKDDAASDIDLAVVISDTQAKTKVENLFEDIDKKVSKKFGNTITPYINTKSELKVKHKKRLDVIKNILNSYTLIYGERLERIL